jgi:hypothetical protein
MEDRENPIRTSRAQEINVGVWYFGAGHLVCRLTDIKYDQLTTAFGDPHVEKSGDAFGSPRRFFWSMWDNLEEVRLVIGSDSNEEDRATRWKVGAFNRKEHDTVLQIVRELFSAEHIVLLSP